MELPTLPPAVDEPRVSVGGDGVASEGSLPGVAADGYLSSMDIVIGIIIWGGLLWLTIVWLSRGWTSKPTDRGPGGPGTGQGAGWTGGNAGTPAPPTARQPPADEQRLRVDDALVDGLVIGHFLTRDHYQRRIGELEDSIDEFGHERDPWLDGAVCDDDLEAGTDYAEFDAMGGFGVEPWADDLFDMDDED